MKTLDIQYRQVQSINSDLGMSDIAKDIKHNFLKINCLHLQRCPVPIPFSCFREFCKRLET